ncbi:hypothetical protein CYMTET_10628 [Cymbomonas tetramitiformis]|uniref:Uncharacterized protein n=1 Tax=Cymbomonas tetramitiformis TaxID=36881 RepID=A0AAE0GP43_9CHLO|nr:hypothetical protein CYMTET_10628 [Cymbomonas tetramitiformis]
MDPVDRPSVTLRSARASLALCPLPSHWMRAIPILVEEEKVKERRDMEENMGEEVDTDGGEVENKEVALGRCMGWKKKWVRLRLLAIPALIIRQAQG